MNSYNWRVSYEMKNAPGHWCRHYLRVRAFHQVAVICRGLRKVGGRDFRVARHRWIAGHVLLDPHNAEWPRWKEKQPQ